MSDDDTVADILGLPRNVLHDDKKDAGGEKEGENGEANNPLLDEEIDIRGTAFMDDFDLADEFDFDAAKERTNSHLVQHYLSTKHRLYCIFEGRPLTQKDRYLSIILNALLLVTVFVTCILFCIESYPYYYKRQGIDYSSTTGIFYVETICIAIFIFELIVRLYCVPFKELLNVFFFIDVISVLVYFSDLIIDLATQYSSFQGLSIVRALRLVRVMRVFKLSRYSATLQLVLVVLKNSAGGLTILLVPFILVIMVLSVALYFFEQLNQHWDENRRRWIDDDTGGPSNFQSIPDSIWFSVATVTTTGYGDIVPRTIPGRIVAVILQYIGVLILSFPNIILGTNLQLAFRKYHKNQARRFLGRKFRVVFHLLCFVRLAKDKLAESRRLKAEAEREVLSEMNSNSDTASTATSEPQLVDIVDLDLHVNSKTKKSKRKTNFFATKPDFESIRSSVEGMGLIRDDTIRFWAYNGVSAVTLLQRLLEGFSGVATAEDLYYCFQLDGGPNEHLTLKDICLTLYFLFEGGFVQLFVFKQYTTKLLVCLTQTAVSELLLYPEEGVVECVRGADFARMLWRQTTGHNAQFSLHSLFSSYSRWSSKEKYVDNTSDSLDLKPQHSSPAVVVQGAHTNGPNVKGRSPQQKTLYVPTEAPGMNGSFTGPPAFMLGNTLNSLGGLESKHGSGYLSASGFGDYPTQTSPFHSGSGVVGSPSGGVTIEEAKLQLKLLLTLQRAEIERVKQELQHHTSGRGH